MHCNSCLKSIELCGGSVLLRPLHQYCCHTGIDGSWTLRGIEIALAVGNLGMAVPAVENSFIGLKQTVCFDLKGSARAVGKISTKDWMRFLQVDVGIDLGKVEQALVHTITGGLFVVMSTEEDYLELLRKAETGVKWSFQGNVKVYGWSAGEETVVLQLHNVFSNSNMESIRLELAKFGVIMVEQVQFYRDCPTMRTGVVTVRMKLRPEVVVPTYLYEERLGNNVHITSDRHRRLCHKCLETGHLTSFCRRSPVTRQAAARTKTWAMVAAVVEPGTAPGVIVDNSVERSEEQDDVPRESEEISVERSEEASDDISGETEEIAVERSEKQDDVSSETEERIVKELGQDETVGSSVELSVDVVSVGTEENSVDRTVEHLVKMSVEQGTICGVKNEGSVELMEEETVKTTFERKAEKPKRKARDMSPVTLKKQEKLRAKAKIQQKKKIKNPLPYDNRPYWKREEDNWAPVK